MSLFMKSNVRINDIIIIIILQHSFVSSMQQKVESTKKMKQILKKNRD